MRTTVLIFSYYSFKDPVFQSAVLPYLKAVQKDGLRYILLTWEQSKFKLSQNEIAIIEEELLQANIVWKRTVWHSGKLKLLKKIYDFIFGISYCSFLILNYKIDKIFSEGFPGAIIGHYLSRLFKKPHIIHTFEPHADYMLESKVWSLDSWEYKVLKKLELKVGKNAQHIITATSAYKDLLIKKGINSKIHLIPSCIDMEEHKFLPTKRSEIRRKLNIANDEIVMVYLGKLGGMYMDEEIFQFFLHCQKISKNKFRLFLFTNADKTQIEEYQRKYNIEEELIFIKYLEKREVSYYLSAADIAFCGIRPIPSRRYSSPIKNGEYWASGLPILMPKGISDDYILGSQEDVSIAFEEISDVSIEDITKLLSIPRTKIRDFAFRNRAINTYINNWFEIFG